MTNYAAKTVDEYIASAPSVAHAHLQNLRTLIKSAEPQSEEGIHYGKPYYKFHGYLIGFDAYKHHIGIEIWTDKLDDKEREALEKAGYKTGSRTFQVRYNQTLPSALIEQMIKAQIRRNLA